MFSLASLVRRLYPYGTQLVPDTHIIAQSRFYLVILTVSQASEGGYKRVYISMN